VKMFEMTEAIGEIDQAEAAGSALEIVRIFRQHIALDERTGIVKFRQPMRRIQKKIGINFADFVRQNIFVTH